MVSNGQRGNATVLNAAFASKSVDSTLVGKLGLNRTGSGTAITDVQQQINDNSDAIATNASNISANTSAIAGLATSAPAITGSRASPTAVVAASGVAFTGTTWRNTSFISGSGGSITVTANPQIAAATNVGQLLRLIIPTGANQITLADGTGLDLNGAFVGSAGSSLDLEWDGTNWFETGRRTV